MKKKNSLDILHKYQSSLICGVVLQAIPFSIGKIMCHKPLHRTVVWFCFLLIVNNPLKACSGKTFLSLP